MHQLEGLAAEDPGTVQHTPLEHHLGEAVVVLDRRHQPVTAAGEPLGIDRVGLRDVDPLPLAALPGFLALLQGHLEADDIGDPVHGRDPLALLRWQVEAGIDHAQRFEDPLVQEGPEGPARDHLDQAGGHVDTDAVVPAGAGLVGQR